MKKSDLDLIEDSVFWALRGNPNLQTLGLVLAKLLACEAIVRGMMEGPQTEPDAQERTGALSSAAGVKSHAR